MERQYDNIVIGFGKGGKTLAGALAKAGQSVALIEKSSQMYGGTCINVACIPSKSLENSARLSAAFEGSFEDKNIRYRRAIEQKRSLTASLRQKNYDKLAGAGVEIIVGSASFLDVRHLQVTLEDGAVMSLEGGKIFINTGARPFLPPIPGLSESRFVYTSESMMEVESLPERLVIIGGGYIGLEFASYYANFGSQVTIIQDGPDFIPKEDEEVSAVVLESLENRGVRILRSAKTQSIRDNADSALISVLTDAGEQELSADAILAATGRRPNLEGLHPENAGVELTSRGAVLVDEHLRTTAPNIWAMGDVTGSLQFTYISLDDSRIVNSALTGDGSRTTTNRGAVPYSVFLDPPLSRVGLTEKEAINKGCQIKVARLPAGTIPKAQVVGRPVGLLKVIIDEKTDRILGAHLFCAESHEMINLVKIAMDSRLPYTVLRDAIYTHPTMSEAFNDLLSTVQ